MASDTADLFDVDMGARFRKTVQFDGNINKMLGKGFITFNSASTPQAHASNTWKLQWYTATKSEMNDMFSIYQDASHVYGITVLKSGWYNCLMYGDIYSSNASGVRLAICVYGAGQTIPASSSTPPLETSKGGSSTSPRSPSGYGYGSLASMFYLEAGDRVVGFLQSISAAATAANSQSRLDIAKIG